MGLLSDFAKGVQTVVAEINTPKSFKIGEKFENYVRQELFVNVHYDLLEKTHNYTSNKDYVESSLKPDFKFRDRKTKKEFFVEVKFRGDLYNNKIVWCNERQLDRYLSYNKQSPVFLMLGMGKNPKNPDFLALIPLTQAKYTGLFLSHAEKFEVEPERAILSKELWNR